MAPRGRRADALAASVEAGLAAAADHAFAEARSHLDRALELWEPTDAPSLSVDHTELLVQAARAARFGGDRERSVDLVRRAIAELDARADPGRAALLHARLGEYQYWDDEAALECYGRALELLPAGSGIERARLLTAEGHALMGLRRWTRPARAARRRWPSPASSETGARRRPPGSRSGLCSPSSASTRRARRTCGRRSAQRPAPASGSRARTCTSASCCGSTAATRTRSRR